MYIDATTVEEKRVEVEVSEVSGGLSLEAALQPS